MTSKTASSSSTAGVLDYVRSAGRDTLLDLYSEPSRGQFCCRAVLQNAVSECAQQVVLRLQCTGGAFAASGVQVWVKPKVYAKVLAELKAWAIIEPATESTIALTRPFYEGLTESLCSVSASPFTAVSDEQLETLAKEANEPYQKTTLADLERYTQTQWDNVLHFLVGTVGHSEPPQAVVHFLLQTGLMQPDPEYRGNPDQAPLLITERGYDFMLQDHPEQVWHFVTQYLQSLESHERGAVLRKEALLLLICLSFCRVGQGYLANALHKNGRVMVKDLALFGLLYTRKIGKSTIFYPTNVALQLVSGEADTTTLSSKALEEALAHPRPHDSSHLGIIVQTNFQLCAYTTSELHLSMLGLFCDVQTIRRLPNIVFMSISRDSVKSAFALGIKARQILRFLEKHAHPKLKAAANGGAATPANVVDQIWLWDREQTRVTFTKVYQHTCQLPGEFKAVQTYCSKIHAHVWSSERQQQIYVDYAHAETVHNFCRQWRAQTAARQAQGS